MARASTLVVALIALSHAAPQTDYCQWDTFSATCRQNSVIVMTQALYGRMAAGRCIERDYGYVGCTADVLHVSDIRCSGKRTCSIGIPDMAFDRMSTCPNDLRRYLIAKYDCVQVVRPPVTQCRKRKPVTLRAQSGHLASEVTKETRCGSTDAPWLIEAQPGQRVNFTLHDFALQAAIHNDTEPVPGREPTHSPSSRCHVYSILKEQGQGRTICGGKSRVSHVYLSESNRVEVRMMTGQVGRERHFILEYNVVGCADMAAPPGGRVWRDGDNMKVGCSDGSRKVALTCIAGKWEGEPISNCSAGLAAAVKRFTLFPPTVSIVVILTVALCIGALILCVGLVCIKRRRRRAAGSSRYGSPGVTSQLKDDPYLSAGGVMGGGTSTTYTAYTSSYAPRTDTSAENDYEYVDDLKLPQGAILSGGGVGVGRTDSGVPCVHAPPGHPYLRYGGVGTPHNLDSIQRNTGGANPNAYVQERAAGIIPPQYFELDPEMLAARKAASTTTATAVGGEGVTVATHVTAHAHRRESRPDVVDNMRNNNRQNMSFGHYSQ